MNHLRIYLYLILACLAISTQVGVECRRQQGSNFGRRPRQSRQTSIPTKDIEEAFRRGKFERERSTQQERTLFRQGQFVSRNSRTPANMFHNVESTPPKNRDDAVKQKDFEIASDYLIKKYKLDQRQVNEDLPRIRLNSPNAAAARASCVAGPVTCYDSIYRTINGTCNNRRNPTWGSARSCFIRLLPASYVGASGFRRSVRGGPLPEPRILSTIIHSNQNWPCPEVSQLYVFFGQLLDHDITFTPVSTTVNNQVIQCCPPSAESHPQCAPILIPRDDRFYPQFGVFCLNFMRSLPCPTCRLGPRQQMNQVTAYIDCSHIYGNADNITAALRANDGTGRMRVQRTQVGDLLPQSSQPANDQCSIPDQNQICFETGDARANQHPPLTSLHTVFLREHNRICDALRRINPSWDDERLFQEARKIVGAEMQMVTYNEYLPITLGAERMKFFDLWIRSAGYTRYDPTVNPTLKTDFSTAAFRFGHSIVSYFIPQSGSQNGNSDLLRDFFFYPFGLYSRGVVDSVLQGSTCTSPQSYDRFMVPDVTNYLYRVRGNDTGDDLASFNIQRGRDHGLPGYTSYVFYCSKENIKINNFRDLLRGNLMSSTTVQLLERIYNHVDDIDLFTGIISETPNYGAVIGPTATCIIGLQFQSLKLGDRFYFEHGGQKGSFTPRQLAEIRKMKLSHLFCLNTEIRELPEQAMLACNGKNPMVRCSEVNGIDLTAWAE